MKRQLTMLISALLICFQSGLARQNDIKIRVYLDDEQGVDTVTIAYWKEVVSYYQKDISANKKIIKAANHDGYFDFHISSDDYVYFSLDWRYDDHNRLIGLTNEPMLAEPSDSILIKVKHADGNPVLRFYGRGAPKYECLQALEYERKRRSDEWWGAKVQTYPKEGALSQKLAKTKDKQAFFIDGIEKVLKHYKSAINPATFSLIRLDAISRTLLDIEGDFYYEVLRWYLGAGQTEDRETLRAFMVQPEVLLLDDVDETIKVKSLYYTPYILALEKHKSLLGDRKLQNRIVEYYHGLLQEKLLTAFLLFNGNKLTTQEKKEAFALTDRLVEHRIYRAALDQYRDQTKIGKQLSFTLLDMNKKKVNLADYRGKIVFIDFWYVGCGGCAGYYQTVLSKAEEELKNDEDVVFISVSIDKDHEKWIKGVKSGYFTSAKAVNLRTLNGVHDPIIKQLGVVAYPHPILIDRNGRILSDSSAELREKGTDGLIAKIREAIKKQ